MAGQIVSTFDKESIAKGETALVLSDEQLLFPVLNNLADIETLNITMGAPLSSTPLFTLVDLLLRMQVRYQQYQRGGFYYRDVQKLLRHPYSAYLFEQTQLQAVLQEIKQKNLVFPLLGKQFQNSIFQEVRVGLEYPCLGWLSDMNSSKPHCKRLLFTMQLQIMEKCFALNL